MYGTKARAIACIGVAALVTCGVVVVSLAPSWGHDDSATAQSAPRADASAPRPGPKKKIAHPVVKESPPPTLVFSQTTPASNVVLGSPETASETTIAKAPPASQIVVIPGVEPSKNETVFKEPAPTDLVPPPSPATAKKSDPAILPPPPPKEKSTLVETEKVIDLVSGNEPVVPVTSPTVSPPAPAVKSKSGAEIIPAASGTAAKTDSKGKPDSPTVAPVLTPAVSSGWVPVDPSGSALVTGVKPKDSQANSAVIEQKPVKPATPDEELEKARADEKQLAEELAQKQNQLKELQGRHQTARGRLVKALAAKVEAVTKEMEALQKELKDRQNSAEQNSTVPMGEKKDEKKQDLAPLIESTKEKNEERLKPMPVTDTKDEEPPHASQVKKLVPIAAPDKVVEGLAAKEPPQAVEPAQPKTAPGGKAASGKSKSQPKQEKAIEAPTGFTPPSGGPTGTRIEGGIGP